MHGGCQPGSLRPIPRRLLKTALQMPIFQRIGNQARFLIAWWRATGTSQLLAEWRVFVSGCDEIAIAA
jgi:hypothetical protein